METTTPFLNRNLLLGPEPDFKPFTYEEVAETAAPTDGHSRFALERGRRGMKVTTGHSILMAMEHLAPQRTRALQPILISKQATLKNVLYSVTSAGVGLWTLAGREVYYVPKHLTNYAGKKWAKGEMTSAELFDSFISGGVAYKDCHDDQWYDALRDVCEQEQIKGRDLQTINKVSEVLILGRRGCIVEVDGPSLPVQPPRLGGTPHTGKEPRQPGKRW